VKNYHSNFSILLLKHPTTIRRKKIENLPSFAYVDAVITNKRPQMAIKRGSIVSSVNIALTQPAGCLQPAATAGFCYAIGPYTLFSALAVGCIFTEHKQTPHFYYRGKYRGSTSG
jgi:hypothetical protein